MREKERVEWVDIGKYICIIFVMFHHLEANTQFASRFYLDFFLNVFFFLSGYVYRSPKSFKEHLLKKCKGLLIPWFIFGTINILMSSFASFKTDRNFYSEMKNNLLQVRGYGDRMWFVAALFVTFIPFYFIIKYCRKRQALLISVGLLIVRAVYWHVMPGSIFVWHTPDLPWHVDYIPWSLFWMILGYYFKVDWEKSFDDGNMILKTVVLWTVYLFLVYSPIFHWIGSVGTEIVPYIRSLIGVMAVISLCKIVKTNKYIAFVGANTLTYLAFHGKVESVIEHILKSKMSAFYNMCLGNTLYSVLLGMFITLLVSIVLIIPAQIINKWFPWILGRSYKKN